MTTAHPLPASKLNDLREHLTDDQVAFIRRVLRDLGDRESDHLALAWERHDPRDEEEWREEDDGMRAWHASLVVSRATSLDQQLARMTSSPTNSTCTEAQPSR